MSGSTDHQLTHRINSVVTKLGVSRATVYRMASAGHLKLVKISKRASGITAESLDNHMRQIGQRG